MFRVRAKTWVGSRNLKHTYIFFLPNVTRVLSIDCNIIKTVFHIDLFLRTLSVFHWVCFRQILNIGICTRYGSRLDGLPDQLSFLKPMDTKLLE